MGPGRTTGKKSRNYREAQEEGQIFLAGTSAGKGRGATGAQRDVNGTEPEKSEMELFPCAGVSLPRYFSLLLRSNKQTKKFFFPAVTSNDAVIVTFFPGQTTRTSDQ